MTLNDLGRRYNNPYFAFAIFPFSRMDSKVAVPRLYNISRARAGQSSALNKFVLDFRRAGLFPKWKRLRCDCGR